MHCNIKNPYHVRKGQRDTNIYSFVYFFYPNYVYTARMVLQQPLNGFNH